MEKIPFYDRHTKPSTLPAVKKVERQVEKLMTEKKIVSRTLNTLFQTISSVESRL